MSSHNMCACTHIGFTRARTYTHTHTHTRTHTQVTTTKRTKSRYCKSVMKNEFREMKWSISKRTTEELVFVFGQMPARALRVLVPLSSELCIGLPCETIERSDHEKAVDR